MLKRLLTPIIFNRKAKHIANYLLKQKWLVDNKLYNFLYTKHIEKQMQLCEDKPLRVRLENTNVCPANCSFCPHSEMERKQGYMDLVLFKKLTDEVKEWGVHELVIQGFGEPLMDKYFYQRVAYAKEIGIPKVQTNVNCRYITQDKFMDLASCGLDELFISCNEEGWQNVIDFCRFKDFYNHKMKVYLSGVEGFFIPSKPRGADGVSISLPHNWGGEKNVSKVTSLKRDPCKLLWVTMYVTWEGQVHMCCMDYEAKKWLGDANKSTLKSIWHGFGDDGFRRMPINIFRDYHRRGKYSDIDICKDCAFNLHSKINWWV